MTRGNQQELSSNQILYEGVQYDPQSIGRVMRRGPRVYAEIDGQLRELHSYSSNNDANTAKAYFLWRLGRRVAPWI